MEICCMATGSGKSAMFAVSIIILLEMARNPHLYPDLPVRALPVGLVVTPTKGLAGNIVRFPLRFTNHEHAQIFELKKLGIPLFPYCHETVTDARKTGRDLVAEISECKTWSVVCVAPEHLRDKAWRQITASDVFRANIVYGCSDEAHLIREWGAEFRPQFKNIGAFFRGRLPSSASVMALTATLEPGASTDNVCKSLGIYGNAFSSSEAPMSDQTLNLLWNLSPTECEAKNSRNSSPT
jgi:superfamily II DNA helicase RecQ